VSPRHDLATATELARIGLFGSLAGATLGKIAGALKREEHGPGAAIDLDERFAVLLRGMATADGRMVRPGEVFEPTPGRTLRAVTPVTVASCDTETYERVVRPSFDPP
jgi:hypothetical protein